MKAIRKLATRLRGGASSSADPIGEADTTYVEGMISPVPGDAASIGDAMQRWAEAAAVDVELVDAVWWYRRPGGLEGSLEEARRGEGWVGLYFHGGGYVIGSAKDVRSGGSRTLSQLLVGGSNFDTLRIPLGLARAGMPRGFVEVRLPFPSLSGVGRRL